MTAELLKKENNVVTLQFDVDKDTFEKAINQAYHKTKGKFNIPGFRKGKAPRKLIEKMYGEGAFYDEAINIVFPDAYDKALEDHDLTPVDRANLEDFQIEEGAQFTVSVTVKPEVSLGEYEGVSVEKSVHEVTDEEIQAELEKIQEKNARMIEIDSRPIQEGDIVTIDFKGFIGDEPFEGGEGKDHELTIGSKQFIDTFEDQLIGKNLEDETEVNVTFPADYHAEDLKGKEARFEVKIHAIKEKELPEIDDELIQDVSDEFETVAAYKDDLRKKLEEQAKKKEDNENKERVIQKVVENAQVAVPDIMVESQIDMEIRNFQYSLQYQGLNMETYLQFTNTTMEDLREQMRETAQNAVRTELVLEAIQKKQGIEADDAEMEQELEELAKVYGQDLESFKETLRDNDRLYFKENADRKKTIAYLMDHATLQ